MRRVLSPIGSRAMRCATLALTLAFAGFGCADPKVSMATGPREYTDSDYEQVLRRWTRDESVVNVSELDNLLTVTATYESWDFRWAYVVKYANDYRLTVEQRRTLLDRSLAETQDGHRFYVALYGTNKHRWGDLTRPDSSWIVRLIDEEGNETAPTQIQLVARPGPMEFRYFPYTSIFRHVFRIKFPKTTPDGRATVSTAARWFGLRFAGAEGNEELRWNVDESGAVEKPRAGGAGGAGDGVTSPRTLRAAADR